MSKRRKISLDKIAEVFEEMEGENSDEDFDSDDSCKDPNWIDDENVSEDDDLAEVVSEDELETLLDTVRLDEELAEDDCEGNNSNNDNNKCNVTWSSYTGRHKNFAFTGKGGILKSDLPLTPKGILNLLSGNAS